MKAEIVNTKVIDHIATGQIARRERVKLNLSLREVAKKMGISAPFLSDLERGRRNWTAKHLNGFNNAIGIK